MLDDILGATHHDGGNTIGFEMTRHQADVWWQTGQFGTITATSTLSAWQRREYPARRHRW
jgi:hypothetical protein